MPAVTAEYRSAEVEAESRWRRNNDALPARSSAIWPCIEELVECEKNDDSIWRIANAEWKRKYFLGYDIDGDAFAKKERILHGLTKLSDNWDDCESDAPIARSIEHAERMLLSFARNGILPTYIGPSPDGGVVFEFRDGDRFYLISMLNNGCNVFLVRKKGRQSEAREVSVNEFDQIAKRLANGDQ